MAHENNPDYMQLPLFRIVVDGMYYCGELASNTYTFNDPFSSNSFHTAPGGKTTLEFSENHEKAKLIEGRNNLASHVKRVIEFVTCASDMPKEIKIERSPFPIPLTMNIDYFLDIESENTKLKAENAKLKAEIEQRADHESYLSQEFANTYYEKNARIAELEAERRWIPVSERLPKEKQSVLALDRTGTAYHWEYSKCLSNIFVGYYTHWMPIPEPPEVKE